LSTASAVATITVVNIAIVKIIIIITTIIIINFFLDKKPYISFKNLTYYEQAQSNRMCNIFNFAVLGFL
jgi:hypothetical protein